jgi:hypothetical protein
MAAATTASATLITNIFGPFGDDRPPRIEISIAPSLPEQSCKTRKSNQIDKLVRQKSVQDRLVR